MQVAMFLADPNNEICLQSFQSTLSVGMTAKVPVDSSAINAVEWFSAKMQEYFAKEMKKLKRVDSNPWILYQLGKGTWDHSSKSIVVQSTTHTISMISNLFPRSSKDKMHNMRNIL